MLLALLYPEFEEALISPGHLLVTLKLVVTSFHIQRLYQGWMRGVSNGFLLILVLVACGSLTDLIRLLKVLF